MAADASSAFLARVSAFCDVSLAASLVLYGSYALHYPAALNGLQFLKGSYLKKPFALENGGLAVPKGLGLGVEVDERSNKQIAKDTLGRDYKAQQVFDLNKDKLKLPETLPAEAELKLPQRWWPAVIAFAALIAILAAVGMGKLMRGPPES